MSKKKFLYEDIYNEIKDKIISKSYTEDIAIENEFELAKIYNVSRHTIRRALDLLHSEGYIKRIKGQGTFVRDYQRTEYLLSTMKSYSEMLQENNKMPHSIIYEAKEIEYDKDSDFALDPDDSHCYYVDRTRLADNDIMCIEKTHINRKLCPNIIDFITPSMSLFDLYEKKYGLKIDSGLYHLRALNCPDDIARRLEINENDAVLNMKATIRLMNDEVLYHVDAYYIGEKYTFTTMLKRD